MKDRFVDAGPMVEVIRTPRSSVAVLERKFDPHQPRDPEGKWSVVGVIVRQVLKLRGQEIGVSVHPDQSRTLDFPGGRTVRLEPREMGDRTNSLRSLAFKADNWHIGEGDAVTRISGRPPSPPRQELLIGVKKIADAPDVHPNGDPDEETWDLTPISLHLPPNNDPSFDELMGSAPVATMQVRDLLTLAEVDIPASRVDLGSGKGLDVFRDGGKFTIRPVGADGLTLDSKGVKALHGAITDLWDDDMRDPRPDSQVVERVVKTKAGDITIRMTGEGRRTQIKAPGLALDLDEDHLSDFMSALGDLVDSASPNERSMAAPDVAAELQRLAGHDVTPGHDELHHYWTKGEGLAKWVKSPHPWTALYHHLVKHVPPEMAKRMASAWFHEVLGFWPGEKHVGAVRVPKAGRSALIEAVVAAEVDELLRKFNPHEPRDPDGKWSLVGAAKKLLGKAQQADTPHVDEPKVQAPPKPHLPAHLVAARHDFGERVGRAAREKDALAATPAKFSFHLKEDGSYRGTGQLNGVKGGGSAAALESYVSTEDYNDVNRRLRGMKREVKDLDEQPVEVDFTPDVEAHVDKLVADIDKTMKVSRLQDDVVVHRVVKDGSGLFGPAWSGINPSGSLQEQLKQIKEIQARRRTGWRPDMTGMRFTDTGFVSTSAGEDWPKKWAKQADWQRPAGATDEPVMLKILAPKGTGGIQLSEKGEMEILLERGLSFEVVEDHGVGSDGLRHLDLRVVEP